jgi:hypothetical protein
MIVLLMMSFATAPESQPVQSEKIENKTRALVQLFLKSRNRKQNHKHPNQSNNQ